MTDLKDRRSMGQLPERRPSAGQRCLRLPAVNFSDIFTRTLEKAYTVRKFPGGSRTMYHRWPTSKVKGSRPLSHLMLENVMRNNTLLQSLMKVKE